MKTVCDLKSIRLINHSVFTQEKLTIRRHQYAENVRFYDFSSEALVLIL